MYTKILDKYKKLSAPIKTSFWFIVCNVVQKGIAFLTTPIFTRILSQEEYGTVSVYNSWLGIITIISTLQLSQGGFNKAMIKYSNDRDGYASSVLILSFVSISSSFILFLLLRVFFSGIIDLKIEFVILLFIEILFTNCMQILTARERFEYRYKFVVVLTFLANVLATVFSLLLVLNFDGNHALARILGTSCIHVLIYSIALWKIIARGRKYYDRNYWKYSLKFNIPLVPHYLSQQVLSSSDRIMINYKIGTSSAAMYSLAYQISVVMGVLTNAIHATFAPWTYQKIETGEFKKLSDRAFQIELFIGSMCLLFSFFAPEFIIILGGKSYYQAVYIIPPVSMSVLFSMMYSFFANIEFYFEKTKIVLMASCIVAVLNIILNWFFIPIFGFVAAGYTTLACYMGYCMVHYLFMKKVCAENNIQNPYSAKKMWGISLVFTAFSICVSFFYDFTIFRYLVIILVTILIMVNLFRNKEKLLGKD